MKHLAIIGASFLQLPLIEKAKTMGFVTHVFAWRCGDVGESCADHFYPISIVEKDKILDICRQIPIDAVCSIASDLAVVTVNYVAHHMHLNGNPIESVLKCTNKYAMRRAFLQNGDPSPMSVYIKNILDLDKYSFEYPVIVKPTDRSGSRGICKVLSEEFLSNAVCDAMEESLEKAAIVETFVEGQEYSVEYISYQGVHHFLALTLKHTTGAPHFIETGHIQPAPVEKTVLSNIQKIIPHALNTLGIVNGASHSEIKIAEDGTINIIEIGARMGGDCIGSDMVRYSTGYDYVKMVIDVACGIPPSFQKINNPIPVEVRFILTKEDLEEFEELRNNHPDMLLKVVNLNTENIGNATNSSNRAGCYIKKYTKA